MVIILVTNFIRLLTEGEPVPLVPCRFRPVPKERLGWVDGKVVKIVRASLVPLLGFLQHHFLSKIGRDTISACFTGSFALRRAP